MCVRESVNVRARMCVCVCSCMSDLGRGCCFGCCVGGLREAVEVVLYGDVFDQMDKLSTVDHPVALRVVVVAPEVFGEVFLRARFKTFHSYDVLMICPTFDLSNLHTNVLCLSVSRNLQLAYWTHVVPFPAVVQSTYGQIWC